MIGTEPIQHFIDTASENLAEYFLNYLKAIEALDEKITFLRADRNNLIAVMTWCYENEKWKLLAGLVSEISPALGYTGFLDDREFWARKAIVACEHLDDKERACWFTLRDVVWVLLLKGDTKTAKELVDNCLRQAKSNTGFERIEAFCYGHLGRMARDEQNDEEAQKYFKRSLEIWDQLGKIKWTAYPLAQLGLIYLRMERLDDAQSYLKKSLAIQQQFKNKAEIAETTSDLALVALAKNLKPEAIQLSQESISTGLGIPQPNPSHAHALYVHAQIAHQLGQEEEAINSANNALKFYSDLGFQSYAQEVQQFLDKSLKNKRRRQK